jgi:hypothetical protein
MVSGYGLFGAGVIDNRFQLTSPINAMTEEDARADFMRLYARLLVEFIGDQNANAQARTWGSDHLRDAVEWMLENGLVLGGKTSRKEDL